MLGDISDMTVLDAFAGSGALGLEAISRGASHATLIELDKDAYRTIQENIHDLGLHDQVNALRRNVKGWSANNVKKLYDIVLCDPPYDAVLEQLIHNLSRHVKTNGLLVVSWPTKEPTPEIPNMNLMRSKTYGNATLYIYRKQQS